MPKTIVYVLKSDSDPDRYYVGLTSDLPNRLEWHNFGPTGAIARGLSRVSQHRPGKLACIRPQGALLY